MIDKLRKRIDEGAKSGDLLPGGYMLGEKDYLDAQLLKFLNMPSEELCEVVRSETDDRRAAQRILEKAGKSESECARWSLSFLQQSSVFLNMIDADEGRKMPPPVSEFLRDFYNANIVPAATAAYVKPETPR